MEPAFVGAIDPVGERQQIFQIADAGGAESGDDVHGRADDEQEHHQQRGQHHVEIGEAFDAAIQAATHRVDGRERDRHDHADLTDQPIADAEQMVQPRGRLCRAQPQRGGKAEQGGEHRDDIDDMAAPAPYTFTQQGVEHRAQRQRQALVVGEEGQRQADHGIHGPRVKPIVEDGGRECRRCAFRRTRWCVQWRAGPVGVVRHWLGDPPEHQAGAHAGREQHREPGHPAEFRLGVASAQTQAADRVQDQQ